MTRFVKYIINNLNRKNRVVKFIFRLAITNDNLLGDIFLYILYKCSCSRNILEQGNINTDDVHSKLITEWKCSFKNGDIRLGSHINELVLRSPGFYIIHILYMYTYMYIHKQLLLLIVFHLNFYL